MVEVELVRKNQHDSFLIKPMKFYKKNSISKMLLLSTDSRFLCILLFFWDPCHPWWNERNVVKKCQCVWFIDFKIESGKLCIYLKKNRVFWINKPSSYICSLNFQINGGLKHHSFNVKLIHTSKLFTCIGV